MCIKTRPVDAYRLDRLMEVHKDHTTTHLVVRVKVTPAPVLERKRETEADAEAEIDTDKETETETETRGRRHWLAASMTSGTVNP